ncbi:hypothetical protein EDB92DRAFT_1900536 [Lactarius akahatsu]|uniref:Zinc finger Mcm10/DnaG-type domain-containing protein n=1 Tax=Lactarius akahatsu TaxID=416441 RepID=A0AAD4L931_9AGAM|nr:hypothetical protein EDB92DRAFT_1900536 [Lactarius akahatsu]
MESVASREQKEILRQQSIQRQIAQLQAQLSDPNTPCPKGHDSHVENGKRKHSNATVLAPASPDSKKRKTATAVPPEKPRRRAKDHRDLGDSYANDRGTVSSVALQQPGPSNVISKLSALSKCTPSSAEQCVPERTSSFTDKASGVPARDDNLTLIEELELGPYDHKSPFDDPLFERLEPHSGIRLSSRKLPYQDLQAYMTGRYYISPSKLYSIVRTYPGAGAGARGQVYDVPVVGDWVTIAVVAERSPIRVSRAPVTLAPGEARDADDPDPIPSPLAPPPHRSSKSANKDPPPRAGRKYVNLTLVDFGVGGKKGTLRGDAVLSLLLFESDSYDTVSRGDGLLPEKIYKGGGRGAFEAMAKLREGTVVALLNPRVLKPIQKPGAPNVLALTPESAASMAVIGTAQDLGMCGVVKRDGKPCGSWCDKRISEVCDYHVQHAVERRRAARPEFSSGTSGMGAGSSSLKRKAAAYDPQRKWGLAPGDDSAPPSSVVEGATYVVAGHVVASGKRDLFVNENVGREAQARAARKAGSRDVDKALKRLLARDKEGMKAVQEARSFAKKMKDQQNTAAKPSGKEGPSGIKKKQKEDDVSEADSWTEEEDENDGASTTDKQPTKNAYSAQVIKQSAKGQGREEDASSIYSKLAELASRREPDKISLTHRPGGRVLSVVSAPKKKGDDDLVDLDESSDDELVVGLPETS